MTRGSTTAAIAACVLGLALAPSAGADADATARVPILGSGTLTKLRVPVLASPHAGAKRVAVLNQFRSDYRAQWVLALDSVQKKSKPLWYRVTVPGRPNGQTGWVRAEAVDVRPVRKRLVIDRGARTFKLFHGARLLRSGRVAVGKPGAETPLGLFYVTWRFDPNGQGGLGDYAFETSAYSKLSDWPGGGIVGVHGTHAPQLLGQAVSHGCVRLHNRDINFLRTRVPIGTPIEIVR
jgi:L,D-transpeptidase catalytic domain